jgi:hypothetical protein
MAAIEEVTEVGELNQDAGRSKETKSFDTAETEETNAATIVDFDRFVVNREGRYVDARGISIEEAGK